MRKLSDAALNDQAIRKYLDILADKSTLPDAYASTFYKLGEKLSIQINKFLDHTRKITLACTTEDADWLSKGIFDHLAISDKNLAVLWNSRTNPYGNKDITIAPIIKSYIEDKSKCDTLIICKSIIFTSCVVRTNLTFLINEIDPDNIIIASPVIFKSAEKILKNEFEEHISDKFKFIYFAEDDIEINGEVVPGIGGDIYTRLGFISSEKNKYVPEIVKERRAAHFT